MGYVCWEDQTAVAGEEMTQMRSTSEHGRCAGCAGCKTKRVGATSTACPQTAQGGMVPVTPFASQAQARTPQRRAADFWDWPERWKESQPETLLSAGRETQSSYPRTLRVLQSRVFFDSHDCSLPLWCHREESPPMNSCHRMEGTLLEISIQPSMTSWCSACWARYNRRMTVVEELRLSPWQKWR